MCIYYNLLTLPFFLLMNIALCMAACNNAEYEINGQCCPMCDAGKRVLKHCDDIMSTTCDSCRVMTYTNFPNGLTKCLPCYVCDPSNGLRVKHQCTLIANTVCEPVAGYYCIDLNCQKALKHSVCSPGQYINQSGTDFSDTVCDNCPVGSYSDGTVCKLHTKCESIGAKTVKEGTKTSDAECSNGLYLLVVIMPVCGIFVLLVIIGILAFTRKKNMQYSIARQTSPP